MKVIGAGLPRTGTMSTKAALEHLGYPCYHMETVGQNRRHLNIWDAFTAGKGGMDWHNIFQEHEATVDAPACFYYKELMEAFPDAKVLLNVRDPYRWHSSTLKLYKLTRRLRWPGLVIPQLGQFVRFTTRIMTTFAEGSSIEDVEACAQYFEQHNQAVIDYVPADRLLVFEVKDGWEPLCEFLECDVPDIPFPHLNSGIDTVKEKIQDAFMPNFLHR